MNQPTQSSIPGAVDADGPLFKPFRWVSEQHQRAPCDMLSDVRDIAAGVSLALEMVERAEMSQEAGRAPLIGATDRARLTRLAIAAMRMIETRVDGYFEHLGDSSDSSPQVDGRSASAP